MLEACLELDEHVGVFRELTGTRKVRAPQVVEVAAVGRAGTEGGVHLAQQQHDAQLYEVWPVKASLLRCLQVHLHLNTQTSMPSKPHTVSACSTDYADNFWLLVPAFYL